VQAGESAENHNGITNPSSENPAEMEEKDKQKHRTIVEEVLFEDIIGE
jgi:hypothetical protein